MNNKTATNIKRFIIFLNAMFCTLLYTSVFAFVWENFYNPNIGMAFFKNGNIILYVVYALIYFIIIEMYGGFRIGSQRITDSVFTHVIAIIITDFISYLQISLIARELLNPFPLIVSIIPNALLTLGWSFYIHRNYARLFPPKKMILVYASKSARSLVYKMSKRYDKFIICAAINVNEGFERISALLPEYDAVVICDTPNEIRNDIMKFCFRHRIMAYVTPKISDILIRGSEELHILDTPLLVSRNFGAKLEQRAIKRFFDFVLSAIAVVVLSPLLAGTAIAVKAYDGGPVIYKQKRLTYGGREFYLYKFRSMVVNAESDGVARLAAEGDSRITPVGEFIRKTRLDELPQLINILNGTMSLVGPRPLIPQEDDIRKLREEYNVYSVRPGMTGWAQVNGRDIITRENKALLDKEYVEKQSLGFDIKILFMTVLKVIRRDDVREGKEDKPQA